MLSITLVLNFLIAFGACQAFFISVIIFTNSNKTFAHKIFSLFLIIEGITLIERLLFETNLINSVPHLLGVSYPISFIKPPLLLFLAFYITNRNFKLKRKHYPHFIPFVLILLMNIPFYGLNPETKLKMVAEFMNTIPTYSSFEFYFNLSFFFHIGVYIGASIYILKRFKTHVKNNQLVNWYLIVLFLYIFFLATHFVYYVLRPSGLSEIPMFNTINMLVMTFIIQAIAYKFISGSNIFHHKKLPDLSDLAKRQKDEEDILNMFEREKIYLDDSITLKKFSNLISLPSDYISDFINQRFDCSFKNLLNQYRVQEAKSLMEKNKNSKVKLIEIAYDSGFNNKVTFYRTFKKVTGNSPSEYLETLKRG